jgi:vanillate/3-O-methylgallate O-demethylase
MQIKFDHDFIGREALEKMSSEPHRKKIWLTWNNNDVLRVIASMFSAEERFNILRFQVPTIRSCHLTRC